MLSRLLAAVFCAALGGFAQEVIHFERDFPGAIPEHFTVSLTRTGAATYAESGEDPIELEVGAQEADEVFAYAAELDFFANSVASRRKVASTGKKILRYESDGVVRGTVEFDYSEIATARKIASWFVNLAGTYRHLEELNRTLRFDRLGVNKVLVAVEQAFERDRIVAPGLLVPILDKIAQQPRIVHLARARAEGLLERIRNDRK